MASPPNLKRIEVPVDAPAWFEKFLAYQLNPFLTAVTDALTGKLSLVENIQAVVAEAQIQTLVATPTFRPVVAKVPGFKPKVWVLINVVNLQTNRPEAVGPLVAELAEGGIKITDLGGLSVSSKYKVTLLALG